MRWNVDEYFFFKLAFSYSSQQVLAIRKCHRLLMNIDRCHCHVLDLHLFPVALHTINMIKTLTVYVIFGTNWIGTLKGHLWVKPSIRNQPGVTLKTPIQEIPLYHISLIMITILIQWTVEEICWASNDLITYINVMMWYGCVNCIFPQVLFGYILEPFVAIISDNDLRETFWWQVSHLHVVCCF